MIRVYWLRARDEWRASRRLRMAGLIALAFVAFHLASAIGQRREALQVQYVNDLELEARLQGMRGQTGWDERAVQSEATLADMRARMPEVTGAGLAQAEVQNWLTSLAEKNVLTESRVRVEDALDVPGYPDMWQVVARLDAQLPQYGDAAVLRTLSEGLPWIQAERLEISEGAPAKFALVVRAYYRRATPLEPLVPSDVPSAGAQP